MKFPVGDESCIFPGERVTLFQQDLRKKFGSSGARLLPTIAWQCKPDPTSHNGENWCVLSIEQLADLTGQCARSVQRAAQCLVQAGLLEVGCFNEDKRNRTNWYRTI
jgi:hypothetical protein